MSFFDPFSRSSFIVGCGLVLGGFSAGFTINEYFSDHVRKVESVETARLSNDMEVLQQQILAKDESIQMLTEQLSRARQDLLSLRNNLGSSNLSSQVSNQKYSELSQQCSRLSGMYSDLQVKYQRAEQNCNVLTRIDFLEQKRRNLENQLSGIQYDAFEKDRVGKKQELQLLLAQNNEQLLNLQQRLSK